jgi:glycosyltransferase involved in cell wall biosynthesis
MRIAYMLTSLGIGGAERQVAALAERMIRRGHKVVLVVLKPRAGEEWPTGLDVTRLDMRKSPLGIFKGVMRGRKLLREFRPDIVHSHTYPANMTARMLKIFGAAPVVLSTIHNVYEGGRLRMLAYRLTDRLSRRTTAVSAAAADRFVRLGAVPSRKCAVLTNGIDTEEFKPDFNRRARARAEMDAGEDFIWLAAGRIVPAKDFPNLLRAFAQVRRAEPRSQLWIAGEGNASGSRKAKHVVVEHGQMDGVHWLGLRRDMPAVFDAADAFVLASAWEGMPLVVGEAMAMEKPVVATDAGGVSELLGDLGSLVQAKDSDMLAQAMLAALRSSPQDREAGGRAARERIEAGFSLEARADEWEGFYQKLLA